MFIFEIWQYCPQNCSVYHHLFMFINLSSLPPSFKTSPPSRASIDVNSSPNAIQLYNNVIKFGWEVSTNCGHWTESHSSNNAEKEAFRFLGFSHPLCLLAILFVVSVDILSVRACAKTRQRASACCLNGWKSAT